jgi:hypothetical protein
LCGLLRRGCNKPKQSSVFRCAIRDHENQLRSCFPTQAALGWGTLVSCRF